MREVLQWVLYLPRQFIIAIIVISNTPTSAAQPPMTPTIIQAVTNHLDRLSVKQ